MSERNDAPPAPTRGVAIELDGRTRYLRYPLTVLKALQSEPNQSLGNILLLGLRAADPDLTLEQVEDMIDLEDLNILFAPGKEFLEIWSVALNAGIPNDLIWQLSVPEIEAVLEQKEEDDRGACLRAGMITAAIYNVNLRKGQRRYRATDFVAMPDDYLTPEQAKTQLDAWARETGGGEAQ